MSEWPDSFDFETDETCRTVFKPFIEEELGRLQEYDTLRPSDTAYIFHEHARRVAEDVRKTCKILNLSDNVANNMYWAVLPHDIGKQQLPVDLWDIEDKPDEEMKNHRRTHTELGAKIVEEKLADHIHPFKDLMEDIMLHHHEQMDGGGYRGLSGDDLSAPVRLAAIVEAFDGWRIHRPHFGDRDISIPGVLERMRTEKAGQFDPELLEAFATMKMAECKSP